VEVALQRLSQYTKSTPPEPILPDIAIKSIIQGCIATNKEDLLACGYDDDAKLIHILQSIANSLLPWITKLSLNGIDIQHGPNQDNSVQYHITGVDSSEETIWSPLLGMKGKLDLLLQSVCNGRLKHSNESPRENSRKRFLLTEDNEKDIEYLLPLEIKTGRWKASMQSSHRAQVSPLTFLVTPLRHI
jgi:hypothetical protein